MSGNLCAFPDCETPIIDPTGCVIGEICHICAQRPDGPRYESLQTDDQRHGFDNLVLLCSRHHKLIDTDHGRYPPDLLRQWKLTHEGRFARSRHVANDEIVDKLLAKVPLSIEIAGNGNTLYAGPVTIVVSNDHDMRRVPEQVYHANALHHQGVAHELALQRAHELNLRFLEALERSRTPASVLEDPDMQYALFSAQKTAARTNSAELAETLVSLLVARAIQQNYSLLRIVLTEAIDIVARLTTDLIDTLTLFFVVQHVHDQTVVDVSTFRAFFDRMVVPLMDRAATDRTRLRHLEYTGCVLQAGAPPHIAGLFVNRYGHAFSETVDEKLARAAVDVDEDTFKTITQVVFRHLEAGKFTTFQRSWADTELALRENGISGQVARRVLQLLRKVAQTRFESAVGDHEVELHPRLHQLRDMCSRTWMKRELTGVGIAIGHANLRRYGITEYRLPEWLT